jgi:hypothetical protein
MLLFHGGFVAVMLRSIAAAGGRLTPSFVIRLTPQRCERNLGCVRVFRWG